MAFKTIYEGGTLEGAIEAIRKDLLETDKKRDEWLANQKNQQLAQSSEVPDGNNIPSSDTSINLGQGS